MEAMGICLRTMDPASPTHKSKWLRNGNAVEIENKSTLEDSIPLTHKTWFSPDQSEVQGDYRGIANNNPPPKERPPWDNSDLSRTL